jgi:tetratricopeptide (TPR) repeat protein
MSLPRRPKGEYRRAGTPVNARRTDRRRVGVLLTVLAVASGGLVLRAIEPSSTPAAAVVAVALPHGDEVRRRFDEAVVMLHAKRYDHAVTALHRVLVLAPGLAEAHVNMGYALLGLKRTTEARAFFEGAMAIRPELANAYYGLALANEAAGDLALATGAMRSYLHLARDERPEHLRRARAALWEWENKTPKQ